MVRSPFSSIVRFSYRRATRRRGVRHHREIRRARRLWTGRETVDVRQQRAHAAARAGSSRS
jgi:hypothetical protein